VVIQAMRNTTVCLLIVALMGGCSSADLQPPQFNGESAYRFLCDQVEFGPRVPGSEAWRLCRGYYTDHFASLGLTVDSQVFSFLDPYSSETLPLVNLVVTCPGANRDEKGIVVMAHYDSRPRTDFAQDTALLNQPIDGANDGASGVAVLMELARLMAADPPAADVDLVLVDGEDWGQPQDIDYYLLGSREFARRGIREKYRFGIVLDMIGDADQQIYREGYSERFAPEVNNMIFSLAEELGISTLIDSVKFFITDDHLSINTGGVPSVDLIDFDYRYWHTEFDTVDKCSPESLANVGLLLTHILYRPSLWPRN